MDGLREGLVPELPTPLYVLVFPNVFTDAGVRNYPEFTENIELPKAKKVLKRLLRPIQTNKSLYEAISTTITWSETGLRVADYMKDLISAVIWILQKDCELEVRLYVSRDQSEVYCTLDAQEEVLERRAETVRYRLQMSRPSEVTSSHDFMHVYPYIEFHQALKSREINGLKRYDENGEEAPQGSLFTLCDKVRLVFSLLSMDFSVGWLQSEGLLVDHFCAHKTLHKQQLLRSWATMKAVFKPQPMRMIRNYFGEKVALYFAWIDFYSNAMMWPATIGSLCFLAGWLCDYETHRALTLFFSLFLGVWAVFFDYFWSQNEVKLAWNWGTLNFSEIEEQRAEFKGPPIKDPVTGRQIKAKEGAFSLVKRAVSFSVIAVFVMMVIITVLGIFIYRAILIQRGEQDGPLLCALLNAVQIKVMNVVYTLVARMLNDWENHETETEYMDSFSLKLFLFRFVNCYVSLYYIAFIKEHFEGCEEQECATELAFQLGVIFVMNVGMNLVELGWPYADYWIRRKMEERKVQRLRNEHPDTVVRATLAPTEMQAQLDPYDTPMEDYMEMLCQYGYIVLFSSVFPIVSFLALLEILIEIRVDAWKLCTLNRKPFPYRTDSIGIWHLIIVTVSYIGIATNSALIIFDTHHPTLLVSGGPWLNFLLLEHIFLALKYLITLLSPAEPRKVKLGLIWQHRIAAEMMFSKRILYFDEVKFAQSRKMMENLKSEFKIKPEDVKELI